MNLMFNCAVSAIDVFPSIRDNKITMTALDWIFVVSAVLIAPFLIATLIGCCLSRWHVFSRSIVIKQSPRTLWESITVFERMPAWWPVMVERLADRDGRAAYRVWFLNGKHRTQPITIEVVEANAPTRFATKIGSEKGPFQGRWVYELNEEDGGCRVTLTEHGEVRNPFVRAMYRIMTDKAQFVDSYLACLGREFGEDVKPA